MVLVKQNSCLKIKHISNVYLIDAKQGDFVNSFGRSESPEI